MTFSKLFAILLSAAAIVGALAYFTLRQSDVDDGKATVTVMVPTLSARARAGKVAFDANCAKCHGANGGGTVQGPPLVHDIYNPGHHGDVAFRRAVRDGVRQHHWPYGDMPPQPRVTDTQLADIVRYVRELQRTNGIVYRRHQM